MLSSAYIKGTRARASTASLAVKARTSQPLPQKRVAAGIALTKPKGVCSTAAYSSTTICRNREDVSVYNFSFLIISIREQAALHSSGQASKICSVFALLSIVILGWFLNRTTRVCYIYSKVQTAASKNQSQAIEFKRHFAGNKMRMLCSI